MSVLMLGDLGEAAWTARDVFPCVFGRPDRITLVALVRRLRDDDGLLVQDIADRLGISRSYAYDLYHDPAGELARERKRRYCGTCERCSASTCGGDGREKAPKLCLKCTVAKLHDERFWTRETIIEQLQLAAAILGRAPAVADYATSPSLRDRMSDERKAECRPLHDAIAAGRVRRIHPGDVQREIGSWDAALHAAGFPKAPCGARAHRSGKYAHLRLVQPAA